MIPVIAGAAAIVVAAFVVAAYNQLVRSLNQLREAWSGIDVQLRRRASLIPNLVETVRGYAQHERQTFEQVIRARGALQGAGSARDAAMANEALTAALGQLFAVVENYPQLRASQNFTKLQEDLSDTEEKIAFARQFYNRNVLDYNTRVDVFPTLRDRHRSSLPRRSAAEVSARRRGRAQRCRRARRRCARQRP